jgi:hypothetical protein
MVLNTGFSKVAQGHFRATVRYQQGGMHELILGGGAPRFAACAQLNLPKTVTDTVQTAEESTAITVKLEELSPDNTVGEWGRKIKVRLQQPDQSNALRPVSGVNDLTLLVFDRRHAWQQRIQLQESEPGFYAGKVRLPRSGRYDWHVRSIQQALSYQAGRLGEHEVSAP